MHWIAPARHSAHSRECRAGEDQSGAVITWYAGSKNSNERVRAAHASWAARVSGAGVDGEAVGSAGVMAELSPVPLEQRRGPWSDCRQSAGADARAASKARFVLLTLLSAKEMEAAKSKTRTLYRAVSCAALPRPQPRLLLCFARFG